MPRNSPCYRLAKMFASSPFPWVAVPVIVMSPMHRPYICFDIDSKSGKLDIVEMLKALSKCRIKRVMVEGGAQIIHSFLHAHQHRPAQCSFMWHMQCVITIAPIFISPGLHYMQRKEDDHQQGDQWVLKFDRQVYHTAGNDLICILYDDTLQK